MGVVWKGLVVHLTNLDSQIFPLIPPPFAGGGFVSILPAMSLTQKPKIVAYLKPTCGWSTGVRAILCKYNLPFEDRDIINDPVQYEEMVSKSGQPLSPCVEVDGRMIADVSGDEVEAWLAKNNYISMIDAPVGVSTNSSCSEEDHAKQAAASNVTLRP